MNNNIIYSVNDKTSTLPITMNTICANFKQKELISPKGRNFHQILLVVNGKGYLKYNEKTYELKKGSAFFIAANIPVYYKSTDNLITAFLTVHGSAVDDLMAYYKNDGFLFREYVDINQYLNYINDIINEFYSFKRESFISSMAYSMYVHFFEDQIYEYNRMKDILHYIENNFTKKITLKEISNIFTIPISTLSHNFKKEYGYTIFELILNLRLNYANNLLQMNRIQKIHDIAYNCGFEDVSYFCKAYKNKFGVTPSKNKDFSVE